MKNIRSAFLICAATTVTSAYGQSLTDLGPNGANSYLWSISGDGNYAAGHTYATGPARATRWSANGTRLDLGSLGGPNSIAHAISQDGSVVVGYGNDGTAERAFRWTQGGGMVDLGVLAGGINSHAWDVSADGSTVVGDSESAGGYRAFIWTQASGMVSLGFIGGNYSVASGVSGDGTIVVGDTYVGGFVNAVRWTQAGGMVGLGTLGGNTSHASAISDDGNVIVGESEMPALGGIRAFRWTQAGGMVSLGEMGGGSSSAAATSADGSVIVGHGNILSGDTHAFRWTQADGMTDLGTLGGTYSRATGVSADGLKIAGYSETANGEFHPFLYTHRVMLDVQDWLGSVSGIYSHLSTSLELTRLHIEGAHHRPLAELGRGKSYWVTGDVAGSSRSRDLITRSGEAGVTFEPWTNVLAGVGAGYGRQDQQLLNDGSASTYGQYLVGELDFLLADGGILSVLVSSGDWQNETDRGYVTGGGVDYSHGETDIKSTSFRLRYDTPTLIQAVGADLKAYVSYGQSRSRADGYDETGGSFAGSFGEMEQTAKEGRLGVAATRKLGEKFRGRLSAEWVRRFDREQASITATDITSTLDLTLPGAAVVRDQARFGFDFDYLMDAKTTLSFTVHAAGRGEVADVSGAISLRKAF